MKYYWPVLLMCFLYVPAKAAAYFTEQPVILGDSIDGTVSKRTGNVLKVNTSSASLPGADVIVEVYGYVDKNLPSGMSADWYFLAKAKVIKAESGSLTLMIQEDQPFTLTDGTTSPLFITDLKLRITWI